jgi:hypothetical protein
MLNYSTDLDFIGKQAWYDAVSAAATSKVLTDTTLYVQGQLWRYRQDTSFTMLALTLVQFWGTAGLVAHKSQSSNANLTHVGNLNISAGTSTDTLFRFTTSDTLGADVGGAVYAPDDTVNFIAAGAFVIRSRTSTTPSSGLIGALKTINILGVNTLN